MSNYGFTTGASGYDDADRLKNWNRSDGGLDHSWDLSLVGDWNSQTVNTQATSFTHNNAHELIAVGSTPLAYDIKGNLTTNQNGHTYTWDFNNRMEGADTDSDSVDDLHFTYDAIGRRVSRNDGTTNTIFVSSGQQVIAEYLSGSQPTSPTEQYVYALYIDEPLIKIGTGGTLYYHRNRQYSIVALSDPTGNIVEQYAYTSTGVTTTLDATTNPIPTTTKNNPYTYTSRRLDPTLNLYYFRARWFDPQLGRFTNRDPLQYVDGMSLYRGYFLGNGTLDPSGMKIVTSDNTWFFDGIVDQLCPEGDFKFKGRPGSWTLHAAKGFCEGYYKRDWGYLPCARLPSLWAEWIPPRLNNADHPVSCKCLCDAVDMSGTVTLVHDAAAVRSSGGGRASWNRRTRTGTVTIGANPSGCRGTGDSNPPGGNANLVRDPPWLIFAHELCGHIVNNQLHPTDGTRYTATDPVIIYENEIRREHSGGGNNWGARN